MEIVTTSAGVVCTEGKEPYWPIREISPKIPDNSSTFFALVALFFGYREGLTITRRTGGSCIFDPPLLCNNIEALHREINLVVGDCGVLSN